MAELVSEARAVAQISRGEATAGRVERPWGGEGSWVERPWGGEGSWVERPWGGDGRLGGKAMGRRRQAGWEGGEGSMIEGHLHGRDVVARDRRIEIAGVKAGEPR